MAPTAGAPCGWWQQALCQILPLESGPPPSVLPGHCVPYAPPSAALWVCWHLGIGQALRAAFSSVACGQSFGVCPAHPWASPASRLRPCAVCPSAPKGLPQNRAGCRGLAGLRPAKRTRSCVVWLTVWLNLVDDRAKQNGLQQNCCNPLIYMVGMRGFEPPTPSSRTKCATRLRYIPKSAVDERSGLTF